jgi:hypothetical protein
MTWLCSVHGSTAKIDEVQINVSPGADVTYTGTAQQLMAETLFPPEFEWPVGNAGTSWSYRGFDSVLTPVRSRGRHSPQGRSMPSGRWRLRVKPASVFIASMQGVVTREVLSSELAGCQNCGAVVLDLRGCLLAVADEALDEMLGNPLTAVIAHAAIVPALVRHATRNAARSRLTRVFTSETPLMAIDWAEQQARLPSWS